jgi:hypothetical protein
MAKYQLQRQVKSSVSAHDTAWADIVTVRGSNVYGPGTKAEAISMRDYVRKEYPECSYRIVKLIKE